jgi:hypothetical protein
VVLLVLIVIGAAAVFYLGQTFRGIKEAAESYDELVAREGAIEEYVPPADGAVPEPRLALFLSIRESLRPAQDEVAVRFADFPFDGVARDDEGSFAKVMRIVGAVAGMISTIGDYCTKRNEALMRAGMGIGEYVYVYTIAYHSWLGHPPEDGPVVTRDRGPGAPAGRRERLFGGEGATFGAEKVRRRHRRHSMTLLRSQLASLADADASPGAAAWRRELEKEISRFEMNPRHVPWQEGLPEAIEASLAPYRDRLEATYDAATNCFELPLLENEGWGNGPD